MAGAGRDDQGRGVGTGGHGVPGDRRRADRTARPAAPVVDETRRVLGVVSEADLMYKVELLGQPRERRILPDRHRREAQAKAGATLAADLMTAPPVTITPDATIVEAARLMDTRGVKRLPVVDDLGRLVGIVTRGDLLKVHLRPDAGIRRDVVEEVLWRSLGVRDGVVDVTVQRGVVTLTGQVERRSTAQLRGAAGPAGQRRGRGGRRARLRDRRRPDGGPARRRRL
ncbi:LOW QUALITY PROTEIN: CBS domain-containing protein, partial [Micromonospora sp. M42]